jgi:hypothetical protein
MSALEDVEGYFCSVCGKDISDCPGNCERPISEFQIMWDVVIATLEDSLEIERVGDNPFVYNSRTRRATLDKIKRWQRERDARLRLREYYMCNRGGF